MALVLKLHQVGGGVIVATPSLVPKNIDQKGRGVSGESFLGNQFLVADGALIKIKRLHHGYSFAAFPTEALIIGHCFKNASAIMR